MYIGTKQQKHPHPAYDCKQNALGSGSFIKHMPDGSTKVIHMPCRKLECLSCGRKARIMMREAVTRAASALGICHHYMLSVAGNGSQKELVKKLQKARGRLLQNMRNHPAAPVSYIWVLSIGGKSARPHLHLYTNKDIRRRRRKNGKSVRWLKPMWHKYTGAQQVEYTTGHRPGFVACYFTDNIFETVEAGRPGSIRIYGSSRDIKVLPRFKTNKKGEWIHCRNSAHQLAKHFGVAHGNYEINWDFEIPSGASAPFKSTQGRGVLPGGGAFGPATPEPGGAPKGTQQEGE